MRHATLLAIAIILFVTPLVAGQSPKSRQAPEQPDVAALLQKIRDLEDRMTFLEGEMRQLKGQHAGAQPGPCPGSDAAVSAAEQPRSVAPVGSERVAAPAGASGQPQPVLGGVGGGAVKALNPDIGAIGNFIGKAFQAIR